MAIVPGNQICIPPGKGAAAGIIKAMKQLLASRRFGFLSRRQFMLRWDKLRKALFLTPEYQAFRAEVIKRAGGMCQMCTKRTADHVHHPVQVSYAPERALDLTNGQAACVGCHEQHHRDARKAARTTQNPTAGTIGLATPSATPNPPTLSAREARTTERAAS
jgi:hypothetical protein